MTAGNQNLFIVKKKIKMVTILLNVFIISKLGCCIKIIIMYYLLFRGIPCNYVITFVSFSESTWKVTASVLESLIAKRGEYWENCNRTLVNDAQSKTGESLDI